MQYQEQMSDSQGFKQAYLDGIEALIAKKQAEMSEKRKEYCKNIFCDPEPYREEFKAMLGWPLVGHTATALPAVSSELLSNEEGYAIYRMSFEILDGVKMTGLYFKINGEQKRPLVLVQHGGDGTPELIAGIHEKTYNYNDMLHRVLKYGVDVFAPQLLLWKSEKFGVPFDRKDLDAKLKRLGSSITAVELYGLTRILDYFEAQDDITVFGMVGLSYGGFYTLFTAAIDTRIQSAVSCSFFNTRDVVSWSDWTWQNAAKKFDDAEIACLVYPRRISLQMGDHDELFDYKHSIASFEKIKELAASVGTDWVELICFDGKHEFYKDDLPIETLIKDLT